MDIPLDDPEANRAAAKIQAGFRGHMTRKKMKPEDKAEGEEVSSTGDVLNGSQGDAGQWCRTVGVRVGHIMPVKRALWIETVRTLQRLPSGATVGNKR